jgi:hypothetical protein
MKNLLLPALFLVMALCSVQSQSVSWHANIDNGLGTANGTDLAQGNLVRIGTFDIPDATIQQNASFANLDSHFIQYGTATIGEGTSAAAHWDKLTSGPTESPPLLAGRDLAGKQIYIWAFNSAAGASATEQGIFYMSKSSNSEWQFPAFSDIPNQKVIDLTDLTDPAGTALIAGATKVWGGFGIGTSDTLGAPLFNLAAVPEPSSYATAFGILCLGGALLRTRFGTPKSR